MSIHYYETEYDEFLGRFHVTVEIEFELEPGEPEVRYTRNGDGYPGSPDAVYVTAVKVTSISGASWDKTREEIERLGWAETWDEKALDFVSDLDIDDELFDHLNASYEEY